MQTNPYRPKAGRIFSAQAPTSSVFGSAGARTKVGVANTPRGKKL